MGNDFKEDIARIKKPSLQFELVDAEDVNPTVETYFGGKPFITNEVEVHSCPVCSKKMSFIIQIHMPDKVSKIKKLYSFYYCFECVKDGTEGSYAVNIYHNPSIEKLEEDFEYKEAFPRHNVQFSPAYELPEWDYLEEAFPEFQKSLESLYGEAACDTYLQLEQKVRDYFNDTGFKLKGYPEAIPYSDIPVCKKSGKRMEAFLSMDCIPELELDWVGDESFLILFKSPDHDEFELRCVDFDDEFEMMDDDLSNM